MKLGLAQVNTTVGDFAGNLALILTAYERGVAAGAELVVAPELAITGYPPRDLLLKSGFIEGNLAALTELAQSVGEVGLVVGHVGINERQPGRPAVNAVSLLQHGKVADSEFLYDTGTCTVRRIHPMKYAEFGIY